MATVYEVTQILAVHNIRSYTLIKIKFNELYYMHMITLLSPMLTIGIAI